MKDVLALLAKVEACGCLERHERDTLMAHHTEAWLVFEAILCEAMRTPGRVSVSPEQLREIRERIEQKHLFEPLQKTLLQQWAANWLAIRSYFRWLFA